MACLSLTFSQRVASGHPLGESQANPPLTALLPCATRGPLGRGGILGMIAVRRIIGLAAAVALVLAVILADPLKWAPSIAQPVAKPLKLALLIGNEGYSPEVGPLANPHNDLELVGTALRSIGFEVVAPVKDAKRAQILAAVTAFRIRLQAAGSGAIGFVYYSGHGAADADTGTNYLIPIDASAPGTVTFWHEALKLDDVLKELDRARAAAKFVVIDACRNELAANDKSTTKGFVPVAEQAGMFVAYATAQGRTASDKGTRGGPYSTALADEVVKPGLHHLDLFQNIKEAVSAATGGSQVPWERNGLARREYLAGTVAAPALADPKPAAKAPDILRSEVAAFCREVATNPSIAVVEALLDTYKGTPMASCASARLNELKRAQVAIVSPPTAPPALPPPKAVSPPAACSGIEAVVLGTKRCLAPGNTITECQGCPELVVVPGGTFMMGSLDTEEGHDRSEGPQRRVSIKPFAVGRYEVTFAEWDACVADRGCAHNPSDEGWGRSRRPVINVSWNDAKEYVAWISAMTGAPYRLLTEAEWEYAARAGTTTPFHTGRTISTAQANYDGNYTYGPGTKGIFREKTIEVGSLNEPNAFGLHEMHGNVWEWVGDCFVDSYSKAPTDGRKTPDTKNCLRVVRGGSWNLNPQDLRSANRSAYRPDLRTKLEGFRIARTLSPSQITACRTIASGFAPVSLAPGDRLCDATGRNTATVDQIADRVIRFTQSQGEPFSCRAGEDCRFGWSGAPVFRVDAEADPARGISPRGTIRPR